MDTRKIPVEDWLCFINGFSREHLGWMATIEVLDPQAGPYHLAENLPLQGLSFDTKGTRPSSLEISVGDSPDNHVTHVIDLPLFIREARESDGSIDLQIEPADGLMTLIHCAAPAAQGVRS